jgi:hypothetical protein
LLSSFIGNVLSSKCARSTILLQYESTFRIRFEVQVFSGTAFKNFVRTVTLGSVTLAGSVADPHHVDANLDADPDPACHFDADPDPACQFDAIA